MDWITGRHFKYSLIPVSYMFMKYSMKAAISNILRTCNHEVKNFTNKFFYNSQKSWEQMYRLGTWELLNSKPQQDRYQAIADVLNKWTLNAPRILDVGCAYANIYSLLEKKPSFYHGIDLSSEVIGQAKRLYGNEPQTQFDAISFEDFQSPDKYDAIILSEVLYYFSLSEIHGLLTKSISMLKDKNSLLIISMTGNPKARFVWRKCSFMPPPSHTVKISQGLFQTTWKIKVFTPVSSSNGSTENK